MIYALTSLVMNVLMSLVMKHFSIFSTLLSSSDCLMPSDMMRFIVGRSVRSLTPYYLTSFSMLSGIEVATAIYPTGYVHINVICDISDIAYRSHYHRSLEDVLAIHVPPGC